MRIAFALGIAAVLAGISFAQDLGAGKASPYCIVLGVAQDGGYPQAGCNKACCKGTLRKEFVSSLAIVDPESNERWLIDCTPSFPQQLGILDKASRKERDQKNSQLSGILLTHAHVGHYSGLVHLGREVIGSKRTPVLAMPRMERFLRENGPWSQLVKLENISIRPIRANQLIRLNPRISVTPMLVPHRDEFSETVAFLINGPKRSVLFLPDIDKWERWEEPIEKWIGKVDVAYLDGTFFDDKELPGRNMSEIPHPFIIESIQRFARLPLSERNKVRFIHLNHTNRALVPKSDAAKYVREAGHHVAVQGERTGL